jgi:hypothetical protein
VLDQVEERVLAPLDVVEHDREWTVRRRLLERLADRPRDVLRRRVRVRLPQERPYGRSSRLVGRADGKLPQDLDHGPVADALAVRQAAAAHHGCLELRQSLLDEPRLADARVGDNRDELAAALGESALPHLAQSPELSGAPDEPHLVPTSRGFADAHEAVRRDRLCLSLQRERIEVLHFDCVARERERHGSEQDLPRLCGLLEACGDIHSVTCDQALLRAGHDLAGVDAHAGLDAELRKRLAHLRSRSHGAKRVVLVGNRYAEDGHHGVPDELLNRSPVPLDDCLHAIEVAAENRT